jgi:hypothetical protein
MSVLGARRGRSIGGIAPALRGGAMSIATVLSAGGAVLACGSKHAGRPDPRPAVSPADASANGGAGDAAASACAVHRAARTYVGFSENMSLDDFELAAFEAERILAALAVQLCESTEAVDTDGSLRAALPLRTLEVTSIVFTQDDAGGADVSVRFAAPESASGADASDAGVRPSWLLELVRVASDWSIVSSARQ